MRHGMMGCALGMVVAIGSPAARAQPGSESPPDVEASVAEPQPTLAEPASAEPTAAEPVVADATAGTVSASMTASGGPRPDGMSVGLGAGWLMPTDLTVPNVASARFRLASGLTLEPRVSLLGVIESNEPPLGMESTDKQSGLSLGTNLRIPLAQRGRADLVLVLGGSIAFSSSNPEGSDNGSRTLGLGLGWGGGIDVWLRQWLSLSATASNPFLSYSRSSQDVGTEQQSASVLRLGLIFDPQIDFMLHLYF